jgi:hypothetical protein
MKKSLEMSDHDISVNYVTSSSCVKFVVFKDHSQGVYVFSLFEEAFSVDIGPSEDFFENSRRRPDLDEGRCALDHMDKILFGAFANGRFLNIILTEVKGHHDFHEPLIPNDLLSTDNQVNQLFFFLLPDPKHISQNGSNFLPCQRQRPRKIMFHNTDLQLSVNQSCKPFLSELDLRHVVGLGLDLGLDWLRIVSCDTQTAEVLPQEHEIVFVLDPAIVVEVDFCEQVLVLGSSAFRSDVAETLVEGDFKFI